MRQARRRAASDAAPPRTARRPCRPDEPAAWASDQRVSATPWWSGRVRATATMRSRCSGVVWDARPGSQGPSESNPRSLNAWNTLRTCDSFRPQEARDLRRRHPRRGRQHRSSLAGAWTGTWPSWKSTSAARPPRARARGRTPPGDASPPPSLVMRPNSPPTASFRSNVHGRPTRYPNHPPYRTLTEAGL